MITDIERLLLVFVADLYRTRRKFIRSKSFVQFKTFVFTHCNVVLRLRRFTTAYLGVSSAPWLCGNLYDNFKIWQDIMHGNHVLSRLPIRPHYVPGGHGSPVCPKRSVPWDFGQFWLCMQVLLGLARFSKCLSRFPWRAVWGRGDAVPDRGSKAHCGSAQRSTTDAITFPADSSHSDGGPSRVIRSDQGLTRFSRFVQYFYGLNVDTGQMWSTFVPTV